MFEKAGLDFENIDKSVQAILKCILDSELSEVHALMNKDIQSMSRLDIYKHLNQDFSLKPYVAILRNRKQRSLLAKTRMGTLPLKVETG